MKFINLCQKSLLLISFFIILIITGSNVGITRFLIILPIVLILTFLIYKKKIIKQETETKNNFKKIDLIFILIIFILSLTLRIIILNMLDIQPISDFAELLNAAKQLISGNNILNTSSYFQCWAYQTGFVLYQSLILKLFNSTFSLHILDCLYSSLSCVFIYLISKKICENRLSSFISAVLYSIGFYYTAYCGILSNQHLFTLLILITIYISLIIKKNMSYKQNIFFSCAIGIILAIANFIRPEAIIYLLSIILYFFLTINNKTDFKKFIINILIILSIYFIFFHTASFIISKTGINKNGLSNNDPLWKFVCGLDYASGGGYSERGLKISNNSKEEIKFIVDNLHMPLGNYKSLFDTKIKSFWKNTASYWIFQSDIINIGERSFSYETLVNYTTKYDRVIYLFSILCSLFNISYLILNNAKNSKDIIIILPIILNFFVYLLIEVQARYSYTARIFFYILAANAIKYIIDFIFDRKHNC